MSNTDVRFGIRLVADGAGQFVGEVNLAKAAVTGLNDAATGAAKGVGGFSDAVSKLVVGGGAIYAFTQVKDAVFAIGGALISAQGELDKFRAAFSMLGDSASVASQLDYVRKTAYDLGIELGSAMNAYRGFAAAARGTALEGAQTREVFTSVAKASTAMGLSASDTEGVLLALSQMISKGTVQAEELRGQLGERLPGAFQIAARAIGVSTSELGKMLEQGQVIADEFLPKFAAQLEKELGQASVDASQSASRELERLKSGWADFVASVADSGMASAIGSVLGNIGRQFRTLAEEIRIAKAEGKGAVGQLVAGLTAGPKPAADVLADAQARLANPSLGFYARGTAEADAADAARKLGVLGAAGPYADEGSRGTAAGFAASGREAATAAAAVARFAAETENLSKAQKKTNEQLALMAKYANAVKGLDQGSADFERARGALTQGLANIDEKYKPKAGSVRRVAAPKLEGMEKDGADLAKRLSDETMQLQDEMLALDEGTAAVQRRKSAFAGLSGVLDGIIDLNAELRQGLDERKSRAGFMQGLGDQVARIQEETLAREQGAGAVLRQRAAVLGLSEVSEDYIQIVEQAIEAERERARESGKQDFMRGLADRVQVLADERTEREQGIGALLRERAAREGLSDVSETYIKIIEQGADEAKMQKTFDDLSKGLSDSLFRAAESGKSVFVALRDTIKGMFANLVLKPIIETGMKEGLSWLSTAAKALLFAADGAAFGPRGPITAFADGGVVSRPTLFPFSGGTGLMGEAGPEAIMPLRRGRDGKLGVVSQGGGGIVVNQSFTFNGATSRSEAYAIVKAAEQQTLATLRDASRRGNDSLIGR